MVYRASRPSAGPPRARPREPKKGRLSQVSTFEVKFRRHKNKYRIWRRAIKRLTLVPAQVPVNI